MREHLFRQALARRRGIALVTEQATSTLEAILTLMVESCDSSKKNYWFLSTVDSVGDNSPSLNYFTISEVTLR